MRIWLAIVSFFKVLFDAEFARSVRQLREGTSTESPPVDQRTTMPVGTPPVAAKPPRSDAIALLATLQREARFVDLVNESLDGYSDAQIGAAARDVLRDSKKVLERFFALEPVANTEEGKPIDLPVGYDAGRYRLTGNVSRESPLVGQLMHAGWQATKCDLPAWTGKAEVALIIAPAEVQVQ
jgi:hypothetical protein